MRPGSPQRSIHGTKRRDSNADDDADDAPARPALVDGGGGGGGVDDDGEDADDGVRAFWSTSANFSAHGTQRSKLHAWHE